jgi:LacI family transcriptional regulator
MKPVTILDVAKRAGVSKATVSAVINAKNTVKPKTRDHILTVMRQLNFRPKGTARHLKQVNRENSIGLIIKNLNNPFYTTVAMGVKAYANKKGYLVFITSSENKNEYEIKFSEQFTAKDIKGAIIAPSLNGDAEIEHLFKLKLINFPFVLLEKIKGIQTNVVSVDNMAAMKVAVKYLIDSGHSKIVHFTGPENASHTYERIEGFRSAYSESHFSLTNDMIVPIGTNHDEIVSKCLAYFKGKERKDYPTAIICYNDQQALGVLAALNALKLQIPGDISVIGYDDILFSNFYPIPLTTIRVPMHQLGYKAAEILIRNIESPRLLPPVEIMLDAEFIIRKSTRALK